MDLRFTGIVGGYAVARPVRKDDDVRSAPWIALALMLAGCGGGTTTGGQGSPTGGSSPSVPVRSAVDPDSVDPCKLITKKDARAVIEVTSSGPFESPRSRACYYDNEGGSATAPEQVTVAVRKEAVTESRFRDDYKDKEAFTGLRVPAIKDVNRERKRASILFLTRDVLIEVIHVHEERSMEQVETTVEQLARTVISRIDEM